MQADGGIRVLSEFFGSTFHGFVDFSLFIFFCIFFSFLHFLSRLIAESFFNMRYISFLIIT